MSDLRIEITDGRTSFRPGELIDGVVVWSLDRPAQAIDLQLGWATRGKGTVDTAIVDTLHVENPPLQDRRGFSFPVPDYPYSFSGQLVSLIWSLRLLLCPSNEQTQVGIIISPSGQPLALEPAACSTCDS